MLLSKTIAEELRDIRVTLGLTQQQFADLFNAADPVSIQTTRSDISRYELGLNTPPANKYIKFLAMGSRYSD